MGHAGSSGQVATYIVGLYCSRLDAVQTFTASSFWKQLEPVCLRLLPSNFLSTACKYAAVSTDFVSACLTNIGSSVALQRQLYSVLGVGTGIMTIFRDTKELEQYLTGLNPNYEHYVKDLWASGVTSTSQLGNASPATLIACGVKHLLHAEDIIAQSQITGKSLLALGDHLNSCQLQMKGKM